MRRALGTLPAVLALAALGACGGEEARTVTVTEGQSAPPASTAEPAAPASGEEPAVATGRGAVDGRAFSFDIVELRRSGATLVLNATMTLDEDVEGRVRIGELFGDGREQLLEGRGNERDDVLDGVAVVDPANRRQYLVARDANGRCVCSRGLDRVRAAPGVPVSLSATLGAPPGGVTAVDVVVPNVRTFTGVALAE